MHWKWFYNKNALERIFIVKYMGNNIYYENDIYYKNSIEI